MKLKYRSKEKETQFLNHLDEIFEDLQALIPNCLHEGMFCPFTQYRKKVEQMALTGRFERYAGSADQFLSAISETHKVKESKSAPVMGVISTPYGQVEYAKRGNADPAVLAGVQNFDNETWRMLAFSTLVKSRGVRVFSSKSRLIGSCKGDVPDIGFFSEILDEHSIAHTTSDIIEIGKSELYLDLVLFGQITVRIHDDSRLNIIPSLMKHILTQDPMKEFSVASPVFEQITDEIPPDLAAAYLSGKKDNRAFIRNLMDYRKKIAISKGYSIVGDTLYSDYESFISNFEDPAFDPSVLLPLLNEREEGLMLDNASFRKLLEILWVKSREQIIELYFPEFEISSSKSLTGDPIQVLNNISNSMSEKVREQSITVKAWSADSEYLIELIRTHVTKGKTDAIRNGEKGAKNKTRKSVFYAYLMAVDGARNREWMFTNEEKELAQKLFPDMNRVINTEDADFNAEIEKLKVYVI